jgi:hypothetical protein
MVTTPFWYFVRPQEMRDELRLSGAETACFELSVGGWKALAMLAECMSVGEFEGRAREYCDRQPSDYLREGVFKQWLAEMSPPIPVTDGSPSTSSSSSQRVPALPSDADHPPHDASIFASPGRPDTPPRQQNIANHRLHDAQPSVSPGSPGTTSTPRRSQNATPRLLGP